MNTPIRTPSAPAWTDLDLELFLDAELAPERSALLRAALATDPALASRLDALRRRDRLIAQALVHPFPVSHHQTGASASNARPWILRRPLSVGLACAASLALLVLAWAILLPPRTPTSLSSAGSSNAPDLLFPRPAAPGPSEPVRGLRVLAAVTLPVRASAPSALAQQPPADSPATPTDVLSALAAGDVHAAANLAASSTDPNRQHALHALGLALRSAVTAEQVLDVLSPAQQVEACRIWSQDPRLRPVTFERLARLRDDPAVADAVAAVAASMALDRELASWVRSYRLVPAPVTDSPG